MGYTKPWQIAILTENFLSSHQQQWKEGLWKQKIKTISPGIS